MADKQYLELQQRMQPRSVYEVDNHHSSAFAYETAAALTISLHYLPQICGHVNT